MVKTPLEIEQIRKGAQHHIATYAVIPSLYHEGMTDRDLQIEIEREMRRRGSIGIFRCFGSAMEIYMGEPPLLATMQALLPPMTSLSVEQVVRHSP